MKPHEQLTFEQEYPLEPEESAFLMELWHSAVALEAQAQNRPYAEMDEELARLGITIDVDGQKVFLKPD